MHVLSAISREKVYGPFLFLPRKTRSRVARVTDFRPFQRVCGAENDTFGFQQDGAPSHWKFGREVRRYPNGELALNGGSGAEANRLFGVSTFPGPHNSKFLFVGLR